MMTHPPPAGLSAAQPEVMIDNAATRVTKWFFPQKGARTGRHVHEYDYVVVPLFTGVLRIETPDGKTQLSELNENAPYFREKGVDHDVINANDFPCAFIEIEFLSG